MVTDFSEPTGTFPSENFTSNEVGAEWILPELLRTVRGGGAYIGVGPEQNFTYIAALQPRIAFVVDIRRQAMLQQLLYKALFELAPDRPAFLSLLFSRRVPPRLPRAAAPEVLLRALDDAPRDFALFNQTMERVINLLTGEHGFALDPDGIEGIRHICQVIFLAGPRLGLEPREKEPPPATLPFTTTGQSTLVTGTYRPSGPSTARPMDAWSPPPQIWRFILGCC